MEQAGVTSEFASILEGRWHLPSDMDSTSSNDADKPDKEPTRGTTGLAFAAATRRTFCAISVATLVMAFSASTMPARTPRPGGNVDDRRHESVSVFALLNDTAVHAVAAQNLIRINRQRFGDNILEETLLQQVQTSFRATSRQLDAELPAAAAALRSAGLTRAQLKAVLHVMRYVGDQRVQQLGFEVARAVGTNESGCIADPTALRLCIAERLAPQNADLRQLAEEVFQNAEPVVNAATGRGPQVLLEPFRLRLLRTFDGDQGTTLFTSSASSKESALPPTSEQVRAAISPQTNPVEVPAQVWPSNSRGKSRLPAMMLPTDAPVTDVSLAALESFVDAFKDSLAQSRQSQQHANKDAAAAERGVVAKGRRLRRLQEVEVIPQGLVLSGVSAAASQLDALLRTMRPFLEMYFHGLFGPHMDAILSLIDASLQVTSCTMGAAAEANTLKALVCPALSATAGIEALQELFGASTGRHLVGDTGNASSNRNAVSPTGGNVGENVGVATPSGAGDTLSGLMYDGLGSFIGSLIR
eukprot:TRINITY_DN55882_c0_g1_i1.p1 TRINITY_DN55882_c0_g1~~TRINITY_DN55882_c0_g1_i1.p1  ORF type:complete len:550 (+),score=113.19 TRINITY_DN55882_c0_g1_i1:65-1651(+)